MDYLTTNEMATRWIIPRRRISTLCSVCRITFAILKGKTWLIQSYSKKPDNPRQIRKSAE